MFCSVRDPESDNEMHRVHKNKMECKEEEINLTSLGIKSKPEIVKKIKQTWAGLNISKGGNIYLSDDEDEEDWMNNDDEEEEEDHFEREEPVKLRNS